VFVGHMCPAGRIFVHDFIISRYSFPLIFIYCTVKNTWSISKFLHTFALALDNHCILGDIKIICDILEGGRGEGVTKSAIRTFLSFKNKAFNDFGIKNSCLISRISCK
jgi:hypothetical protein